MILKSLSLRNFRNIGAADFIFHPRVNLLTGNNAQGKTNLCEAVSVCFGRSFRGARAQELIPFDFSDEGETAVELVFSFDRDEREHTLKYIQKKRNGRLTFNGLDMKNAEELYGALRYTYFIPDDLNIVRGNPEKRRDYLDFVSDMMNRVHHFKLYEYQKALRQKNNLLLKSDPFDPNITELLESWNETLARLGVNVLCGRLKYFDKLVHYANEYYGMLNQNGEKLSVYYESSVMGDLPYSIEDVSFLLETYLNQLRASAGRERRMKYTVVGVHRDDLIFRINGRPAKDFASQGQVRSIAVALKLAEARMIFERSGDEPIMILDDVLSELDSFRRSFIVNHIDRLQTFITSCTPSELSELSDGFLWRVSNGRFERL